MIKIPSLQKIASLPWVAKMLAFASMLAPGIASAAPDFGFTPPCSDKSISSFLVPLFGSLFERCGGTSGPFEQAVGVLNAGAMTIGGMIAAYTLVVGTMQTAHDGEMLGKRWSSMWIPIRTTLGIGLVVPLAGGYCVAQLLIGFLIGQGVGLADKVWEAYVNNLGDAKNMAPKVILPSVDDLARGILKGRLCMEAINYASKDQGIVSEMTAVSTSKGISFGDDRCGGVSYAAVTQNIASLNSAGDSTGPILSMLGFRAGDITNTVGVLSAHLKAAAALDARMQQVAVKIVNAKIEGTTAPDISADLISAEAEYQSTVASAANAVVGGKNGLSELVAAAKNDGWFMAGSWFMKASQLQDTINRVVSNTPSSQGFTSTSLGSVNMSVIDPYMALLERSFKKSSNAVSPATANLTPTSASDGKNGSSTGSGLSESLERIGSSSSPLTAGFVEISNYYFIKIARAIVEIDSNRDPMMALKDTGDTIMVVGGSMIIGAGLAYAFAGGLGAAANGWFSQATVVGPAAGQAAADLIKYLSMIMFLIGGPLLLAGAGLAVYLPMAPFLIFFGIFVGWLLLCLEAIIAAPLWAIMHLSPQGEDIMGGARGGYMLILGLLLRPMLIVMGFIAALISLPVVISSFNAIFFPVFKLSMAGSVVGVFSTVIMVFMYFGTMTFLFHTVFSFMGQIPDKILRWMGGGGEQLGEVGKGMSGSGKGHEKAQVASQLTHSAMQQTSGYLDRKQNRQMDETNKAANTMSEKTGEAQNAEKNVAQSSSQALAARETARNDSSVGAQANAAVATNQLANDFQSQSQANSEVARTAEGQAEAKKNKDPAGAASLTRIAETHAAAAGTASENANREKTALANSRESIQKTMDGQAQTASALPSSNPAEKGQKADALQGAANNYKAMRDAENVMQNPSAAASHDASANRLEAEAKILRAEAAQGGNGSATGVGAQTPTVGP